MSFLPGKKLSEGVVRQVQARQSVLGNIDTRIDEQGRLNAYSFFTEKMPWIRLVSSVNINNSDEFARTSILTNGVQQGHNDAEIPGYEFTSLGYRPKPGITSMNLTTHNRYGSLRTATVQFKVFSVEQLNIYERLYMSPGYSALLEWGHSKFLDSESLTALSSENITETVDLFKDGASYQTINDEIIRLRSKYHYNYDGMYGLIKNFTWSITADGSYDCSVDIVSTGYILESMKISAGILKKDVKYFLLNRSEDELNRLAEQSAGRYRETGEQVKLFGLINLGAEQALNVPPEKAGDKEFADKLTTSLGVELKVNLSKTGDIPVSEVVKDREIEDYTKLLPEIISADGSNLSGFAVQYYVNIGDTERRFNTNADKEASLFPNIPNNEDYTIDGEVYSITAIETVLDYASVEGSGLFGAFFNKKITSYKLELQQAPAEVQGAEADDSSISDTNILNLVRKYNPELHTRIHFFINEILRDVRVDEPFTEEGSSTINFYKEYVSTYATDVLSGTLSSINSQPAHRVTAAKYLVIDSPGQSEENRPDQRYQYIQLGLFLEILNTFITQDQNGVPLFTFDTTIIGNERDFKTLNKLHCSVDPSICLLPQTQEPEDGSSKVPTCITGILLEKEYLYKKLDEYLSQGELRAFDLIQTILKDIVRVTGKVNDFQLQYYEDTNSYRIVDRNFIDIQLLLPQLEVFGKNTFVKTLNITSRLTPNIGTQLAIAAQANPTSNAIEGSAWSRFNQNLEDRIIKDRKDRETRSRDEAQDIEGLELLQNKFADVFEFLNIVYPDKAGGNFSKSIQSLGLVPPNVIHQYIDFCEYQYNKETRNADTAKKNNFILPYVLELTVDGISGFTVMDSFVINDQVIPDRYKGDGGIGFLITGIKHTVNTNGWDTSIQSQIYNLDENKPVKANSGKFAFVPTPATTQEEALDDTSLYIQNTPWSAVFVSYVIQEAVSELITNTAQHDNFLIGGPAHVNYVNQAKTPSKKWEVRDPSTTKVEKGDIIVKNRQGNTQTYSSNATYQGASHGDIVVDVSDTAVTVIGGNVGDSITRYQVELNTEYDLKDPSYFAIVRISTAYGDGIKDTTFANKLADIAKTEYFNYGQYTETDLAFRERLRQYYKAGGLTLP